MLKIKEVFSSFSVSDLPRAKEFYTHILGLQVEEGQMGLILHMVGGGTIFIYPKENHQPATFTVLNIEVENLDAAIEELTQHGITMEIYAGMEQDHKGISHGKASGHGPDIGWFKDPFGNVIAILER